MPYKWFNSLAPGRFEWNFRYLTSQIISVIDGWGISCKLALRWTSLDLTDDKSTLVQVMACCLTASSHYLSQCWPRSLSPYGVTRPQWVINQPTVPACLFADVYFSTWQKKINFNHCQNLMQWILQNNALPTQNTSNIVLGYSTWDNIW